MTDGFDTPSGLRVAFDALVAGMPRELRLYDADPGGYDLDQPARHAALRALCLAGGGRRVELLLDTVDTLVRDHPRLMRLVRDMGHVLDIRVADADLPRPDEAFVLADRRTVLLRPDKHGLRGTGPREDPATAARLNQAFDAIWQRASVRVGATTLGL